MALVGSGAGGSRYMSDEGLHTKSSGINYIVHHVYAYFMTIYRGGEEEGIQQVPKVAGSI